MHVSALSRIPMVAPPIFPLAVLHLHGSSKRYRLTCENKRQGRPPAKGELIFSKSQSLLTDIFAQRYLNDIFRAALDERRQQAEGAGAGTSAPPPRPGRQGVGVDADPLAPSRPAGVEAEIARTLPASSGAGGAACTIREARDVSDRVISLLLLLLLRVCVSWYSSETS